MYDSHVSISGGASPFAGFWRRVSASSIDSTLLGLPIFLIVGLQGVSLFTLLSENLDAYLTNPAALVTAMSAEMGQVAIISAALFFVYKTGFEASGLRATIGKLAMGLRVTDTQGNRLSIPAAAVRSWPSWAPTAVLVLDARIGSDGLLMNAGALAGLLACAVVAITARKRGIHDMMAGALVVRAGARFRTAQVML
jgi:uncharacterized RDD family membrane protein YckC